MRILWITNYPVPDIAKDLGMSVGVSGGWMHELSRQLAETNTMGMVFPISQNSEYKEGCTLDIHYYAVPMDKKVIRNEMKQITCFEKIIKAFQPDVIHIWGTEYVHTFLAVNACKNIGVLDRTVISIQGLVSVIARHYYGHIEERKLRIPTLKDLLYGDSLKIQREDYIARGKYEIASLQMAKHVIGRTDWDYACTNQINPRLQYHFCNETLRDIFYRKQWDLAICEKHSLFVSQCQYPLKGFHHALEALAIIVKRWPDAHLYTTGRNLLKKDLKERVFDSTYERYIIRQIKTLHLEKNVTFLGTLSESEMCEQFCKMHVFVSASSIENSSNSIGEAMCLGVPVVASDVGGTKNLLVHGQEGFVYQADAPYMLAYYVTKIFENDKLAETFSINAKVHAEQTHNKAKNLNELMEIYNKIC